MRKIWDIPGGIHPPENKHQSLHHGIGALPLPDKLVLPLNQHIGAPAKAIVDVGDKVLKGQLLAKATGFVSANIHAPTSGTIASIGDQPIPHPSGMTARCIVLIPDGEDSWCQRQAIADYHNAEPQALLAAVQAAGITGMGGAGFPAAVKLSPRQTIDTLIINGTECEPYITADDILMQERAGDIIEGVKILARILGNPARVIIGIEDNKDKAFETMTAAASGTGFEVVEFPTKYPSGGEKQLVQILTGQEVPSGKLPADLGIVCHNVGTAEAVFRAVAHGEPLISRITTVTGKACATNRNYEVLLGTPVSHLLQHNGYNPKACTRLVMGGPMMGFTLPDVTVPVIKTTNCILACDHTEAPGFAPQQPCIRCGMCAEACPASLLPQQLYWHAQAKDFEKIQAFNLFDCIECGACAYVCPSNIPLVQYYRAAKGEIRNLAAEKRKSDHARLRFEAHKARQEKEEADKAAKREARRLAAEQAQAKVAAQGAETPATAATNSAEDLIKAAMARAAERQASPEQQKAKLERGLEAAQNRLKFAEEKLAEARHGEEPVSGEPLEKLQVKAEEARLKLQEAERKLAEFNTNPAASQSEPPKASPESTIEVQIKTKITASPKAQLEGKIASLHERIASAEAKLAETEDETVKTALLSGLEKQRQKLADAQQQLADLGADGDTPVNDAPALDAAAAAIARAKAKAESLAAMSEAEKLAASVQSLENRVTKARDKLAAAQQGGSEHIDSLQMALDKLEAKLAEAQAQHQQLTSGEPI